MRRFLASTLLLLASHVWAVSETVYVRSTADCAANGCGAENGDAYATAYDGFADVCDSATEETANCLDPDDTLVICGTFTTADLDTVGANDVMKAIGSVSRSGVTYDGDCSAHITNPATWTDALGATHSGALLDGGGTAERGFDSGSSATNATSATFKNIALTGFTAYAIISQATNVQAMDWTVQDVYLYENRGASARGLWGKGTGLTVTRLVTLNTGEDGMYWESDNLTSIDYLCTDPGLDTDGSQGDCTQMTLEGDNFTFTRPICRMSVDVKQCVIVSDAAGTISGSVTDGECYGPSATSTNHNCFFFRGTGAVSVIRTYAEKSRYHTYAADGVALTARSNVGWGFANNGIQCGESAGVCTIENNTISQAATGIDIASATAGSVVRNNAVNNSATGIKITAATGTESYNDIYGATTACSVDGSGAACGTGSITAAPLFVGGTNPNTANGFRPQSGSPLCNAAFKAPPIAGTDYFGKRFAQSPTIGAVMCN
jgi:parallel beta-helix repeat protein